MNRNEFLKLIIATPLAVLFGKKKAVATGFGLIPSSFCVMPLKIEGAMYSDTHLFDALHYYRASLRQTQEAIAADVLNRAFKE